MVAVPLVESHVAQDLVREMNRMSCVTLTIRFKSCKVFDRSLLAEQSGTREQNGLKLRTIA